MRIWKTSLERSREWTEEAARVVLAPGEGERRPGESSDVWRRRVTGRAALRSVLADCVDRPARSLRFVRGPAGKPSLAASDGGGRIHFSLSRGDDVCLIAVSEEAPIGVDVEAVRDFPELERLARARFTPSEAAGILEHSGDRRLRAFYRCWTRKEACVKAAGMGLDEGLEGVRVSVGARPAILSPSAGASLADLDLGDGFAAAVALRGHLPSGEIDLAV